LAPPGVTYTFSKYMTHSDTLATPKGVCGPCRGLKSKTITANNGNSATTLFAEEEAK